MVFRSSCGAAPVVMRTFALVLARAGGLEKKTSDESYTIDVVALKSCKCKLVDINTHRVAFIYVIVNYKGVCPRRLEATFKRRRRRKRRGGVNPTLISTFDCAFRKTLFPSMTPLPLLHTKMPPFFPVDNTFQSGVCGLQLLRTIRNYIARHTRICM